MSTTETGVAPERSSTAEEPERSRDMETFPTPRQPSSVFLTPPSSTRKPPSLVVPPQTPSLHLALLSPDLSPGLQRSHLPPLYLPDSPPANTMEFMDIAGELYLQGRKHISDEIFLYLDASDLCSCLQVCRLWRDLVSSNAYLMEKVTAHRRRQKNNAENVEKSYKDTLWMPEQRRALGTLATPNMQPPRIRPVPDPVQYHLHPSTSKLRPCPNCQSPAKELNLRRAECTKCHFDFCQSCFNRWHGDAECTRSRSPKKPRESASALCGTKKSRKRLKRL